MFLRRRSWTSLIRWCPVTGSVWSGLRYAEQVSHLVVQKALSWPVWLNPLSIEDKLRDCAFTRVGNDLLCGARSLFDVDFGIGDRVLGEKTLRLAAVAAPVGRVDKKLHTNIVADPWPGGEGLAGRVY
jgi:hypothetical protein